jgi:peptidoglycan/LPS O-acetylase OafA/YrhL
MSTPRAAAGTDPLAYRPDIDGLRAVAVLEILLFHLQVPGFAGGYVGVDVFFVVSGYLITRNIVRRRAAGEWSFAAFYGRRLRRLFPAILATLVATFVVGFLLLSPKHFADLAQSILYTGVLAPNLFFWDRFWNRSGYFATLPLLRPLLHFWSLGVEEQYYLLWPVLLAVLLRWRRPAIVATLVLLAAVSAGASEHWLGIDPGAAFYLLPFRAAGLLLGASLVFLPGLRRASTSVADVLVVAGLGMIGYATVFFDPATPYPGLRVLVPVVGAGLVVLAGDAAATGRVLLANRPMVWIGLISFSLYLVHWPLVVFYGYWTLRPFGGAEQLGIAVVSLIAAAAMYRFVERPFRAGPHVRLSPAGVASASFATMLPIMFIAANVWAQGGWAWRVANRPPQVPRAVLVGCRRGKLPGCKLGTPARGRPRMLLIGDSQARSLSDGIYHLARRNGLQVRQWTRNACAPFFDVSVAPGTPDVQKEKACAAMREAWKSFIAERRPQIVVLAGRWLGYVGRLDAPGLAHRGPSFAARLRPQPSPALASQQVLEAALARTVASIVAQGSKVIIVSSPPEPGISMSACRDVPLYLMDEETRRHRCAVSYAQGMAQVGLVDAAIAHLEQDDVMAIFPSRMLCDESRGTCEFYREDGRPLFRDATHLSPIGSRTLAEQVEGEFAARMRAWGLARRGRAGRALPSHAAGVPNSYP